MPLVASTPHADIGWDLGCICPTRPDVDVHIICPGTAQVQIQVPAPMSSSRSLERIIAAHVDGDIPGPPSLTSNVSNARLPKLTSPSPAPKFDAPYP
jgi:hypothetical protein